MNLSDTCPTVLIETDAGPTRINKEDYNSKIHKLADGEAVYESPLKKLTVVQLKALAKEEGIDLGKAKKEDDIIAAIEAARASKAEIFAFPNENGKFIIMGKDGKPFSDEVFETQEAVDAAIKDLTK